MEKLNAREKDELRKRIWHVERKISRLNLVVSALIRILDQNEPFSKKKLQAVMKRIDREHEISQGSYRTFNFIDEVTELRVHNSLLMLALTLLEEGGLINFEHLMSDFRDNIHSEKERNLQLRMERFIRFLKKEYL